MAKRNRIKNIIIIAAVAVASFLFGYTIGYGQMLSTCTNIALQFSDHFDLNINKALIVEYLNRAGL